MDVCIILHQCSFCGPLAPLPVSLYSIEDLVCPSVLIASWQLAAKRSRIRVPARSPNFCFQVTNPFGLTRRLTENSSRGKARPTRKVENLTAICEPTV
jgi:hypothetical protein